MTPAGRAARRGPLPIHVLRLLGCGASGPADRRERCTIDEYSANLTALCAVLDLDRPVEQVLATLPEVEQRVCGADGRVDLGEGLRIQSRARASSNAGRMRGSMSRAAAWDRRPYDGSISCSRSSVASGGPMSSDSPYLGEAKLCSNNQDA